MPSITDLLTRATDSTTGRPVIAKLGSAKTIGASSITISVNTNWTQISHVYIAIYTVTAANIKDPTTQTDWKGVLSGTTISNMTLTGGNDRAYTTDAYVEITFTSRWAKDQYDWAMAHANQAGALLPSAVQTAIGTGTITTTNLATNAVTADKITDGTITTAKLADGSVTPAKMTGVDLYGVLSSVFGGTTPVAGTGQFYMQAGTSVITTDGSGNGNIGFGAAFPNGVVTVTLSDGDGISDIGLRGSTVSLTGFGIQSNAPSQLKRINYMAIGW